MISEGQDDPIGPGDDSRTRALVAAETTPSDGRSMQELSDQECYQLLASQRIGRLGVVTEQYPLIFPVNYGLDGKAIVIRTRAGTKLNAAAHARVSFEVDFLDLRTGTGWSVLVSGSAEEVTGQHREDLVERTRASAHEPWAPGRHDHWLRITPYRVSGRRIAPGELPPAGEAAGYL